MMNREDIKDYIPVTVMDSCMDLASDMLCDFFEYKKESVSCVADYDIIKTLISSIIHLNENIEIVFAEFDGYTDSSYLLTLDEAGLCIDPLLRKNSEDYFTFDADSLYFALGCDFDILGKWYKDSDSIITYFTFEDEDSTSDFECDGDCEGCTCDDLEEEDSCGDSNDCNDIHGFTHSFTDGNGTSTYSFYSSDLDHVELIKKTFFELL